SGTGRDVDFFDVKGVVEQICDVLGVAVRAEPARAAYLVAGQAASLVVADGPATGAVLGVVGQVQPAIADARGLPSKDRLLVGELNLDLIARARLAPDD